MVTPCHARADIHLKVASALKAALAEILAVTHLQRTAVAQFGHHLRDAHRLHIVINLNLHLIVSS
jgi:hypothetical protein